MENSGGSRARQAVAWVLVVMFAVVSIVAVATGFVRYRLLDTDHYVAAMTSLALMGLASVGSFCFALYMLLATMPMGWAFGAALAISTSIHALTFLLFKRR